MELIVVLQNRELIYVGTLRKNNAKILVRFLPNKNRDVNSSLYGFQEYITLLSYVPKNNAVVFISFSGRSRLGVKNK